MPLNIKNGQAHLLARELAELMGESITDAVTTAIREAIARRKLIQEKKRRSFIAKLTEAGIVMDARYGAAGRHQLMLFISLAEISVKEFDEEQAQLALDAYRLFGKGNHPAALNYGDCFSYALSAAAGEPLLYKGENFSKTDITQVFRAHFKGIY